MRNNKSTIFWVIGIILVLAGLLVYPRIFSGGNGNPSANVPCLRSNFPLQQHIHPRLAIIVDGETEAVPANIGLTPGCEKVLHTHDKTGELHIESQDSRRYTFQDFMNVWGEPLEREGYSLKITVDGEVVADPTAINFEDKQQIILEYTKF